MNRVRTKCARPWCASSTGAKRPARKKKTPMIKRAVGPTVTVSTSSTRGETVTSLTSSSGQPPGCHVAHKMAWLTMIHATSSDLRRSPPRRSAATAAPCGARAHRGGPIAPVGAVGPPRPQRARSVTAALFSALPEASVESADDCPRRRRRQSSLQRHCSRIPQGNPTSWVRPRVTRTCGAGATLGDPRGTRRRPGGILSFRRQSRPAWSATRSNPRPAHRGDHQIQARIIGDRLQSEPHILGDRLRDPHPHP